MSRDRRRLKPRPRGRRVVILTSLTAALAAAGALGAWALYRGSAPPSAATSRSDLDPLLQRHLEAIQEAIQRRDLAAAERLAAEGLAAFPDDFDLLFVLGQVRYQTGKWAASREALKKAAAARPSDFMVWHWLAEACFKLGSQEDGIAAARNALARLGFPEGGFRARPQEQARAVVGNAIKVLHRFQEYGLLADVARGYRTGFGALSPAERLEATMAEGVALANLGRYAEAEPLLREATGHRENGDEVAFWLGIALAKAEKFAEARAWLADLLARSPHFSRAYYQLGLVLSRLGKREQAEAMFAKSRDLAPSEREVKRDLELRGAGHPGRAAAALSLSFALRGQPAEAEAALRQPELKEDPHAVFALADFYLEALRAADAEKVLVQAARLVGEQHAEVEGRRALAAFLRGDEARALSRLEALTARAEVPAGWKVRRARLLLDRGRAADAAAILEPIRRSGADREASFYLGRAYLAAGDPARALAAIRSVSSADARWDDWHADLWVALALLSARGGEGEPAALEEAARLLAAAPAEARAARPYLEARLLLLARRESAGEAGAEVERQAAREALARHDAAEPRIQALERQIASGAWPATAPLYLEAARERAARGELRAAVRLARLSLQAAPDSAPALRELAGWLRDPRDAFYRLRVLRELVKLAPGDTAAAAEARALEGEWLGKAG
jgi:predicted Zn-dependent protease